MNLDIDFLIDFFKKYTTKGKNEIGEAEEITSPTSTEPSTSSGGKSPKKWESGLNRGKGNPISNTKWESGLNRGKGNPVGNTKWASGRAMGKTGGSDFA